MNESVMGTQGKPFRTHLMLCLTAIVIMFLTIFTLSSCNTTIQPLQGICISQAEVHDRLLSKMSMYFQDFHWIDNDRVVYRKSNMMHLDLHKGSDDDLYLFNFGTGDQIPIAVDISMMNLSNQHENRVTLTEDISSIVGVNRAKEYVYFKTYSDPSLHYIDLNNHAVHRVNNIPEDSTTCNITISGDNMLYQGAELKKLYVYDMILGERVATITENGDIEQYFWFDKNRISYFVKGDNGKNVYHLRDIAGNFHAEKTSPFFWWSHSLRYRAFTLYNDKSDATALVVVDAERDYAENDLKVISTHPCFGWSWSPNDDKLVYLENRYVNGTLTHCLMYLDMTTLIKDW